MTAPTKKSASRVLPTIGSIALRALILILMFIAFLAMFSAFWYSSVYGDVGFEAVLFSVLAGVEGVQQGLVVGWLLKGMLPSVLLTAVFGFFLLFLPKKLCRGRRLTRKIFSPIALALSVLLLLTAANEVNLLKWARNKITQTKIYQEQYVDPQNTRITFPDQRRNLIYIYLESMENTMLSREQGGGIAHNVIPELYKLAANNLNFSGNEAVGGGQAIYGATWTIGAMVAQGAGLPLRTSLKIDENSFGDFYARFLPGAVTLNDILHENGYRQAFICGSDSAYGGRKQFYSQHGVENVYDYNTALEEGFLPEGYHEWWGMADYKTYAYAKEKITELAEGRQPFAVTLLSVDTHHVGGYLCSQCRDDYEEQYENVYACASRQAAAFVRWIMRQPFYENTTVIIAGDHCSMDFAYFQRQMDPGYQRTVYNCFLNVSQPNTYTKNRLFNTMDMFPTTLAAMGCQIEGERLGLGTNLFSGQKTLAELYGNDFLEEELSRGSGYYDKRFHLGL